MKQLLLSLGLAVFLTSCSSDSQSTEMPAPAQTVKVASQVIFEAETNHAFTLGYNADHTLKSAVSDNPEHALSYQLSYSNGSISKVSGENNGVVFNVDFAYSADRIINGVTVNGVQKIVTYNAEEKYYEIKDNAETLSRWRFVINNDGDLEEIVSYNSQGNFMDGKSFYYEPDQKGPLYNANRVTLQLAIACRAKAILSCGFGGYKPFKFFSGAHAEPIDLYNTFDSSGYVMDSNEFEDVDYATFTYTDI